MSENNTFEQVIEHGDITHHLVDGDEVSMAVKNVFGGDDYYNSDHQLVMHTEHNVFGGENYHDASGKLIAQEIPHHDGSHDLYSPNMHHIGHSQDTPVGHELTDGSGNMVSMDLDLGHGFHDVMHHSDPLLHAGDYVIPDLDLM
jgi:hypothetical protein